MVVEGTDDRSSGDVEGNDQSLLGEKKKKKKIITIKFGLHKSILLTEEVT